MRLPLNANDERIAVQEPAELLAAERRHGLGRRRRLLPKLLTERTEIRFRLERNERVTRTGETYLFDVELRGEQRNQGRQRIFGNARRDADQSSQGLTNLDPDFLSRRPAQPRQRPDGMHSRIERRVDPLAARRDERRQMHRLAGQLAMDPVAHEGADRGQETAYRDEHLVQRG